MGYRLYGTGRSEGKRNGKYEEFYELVKDEVTWRRS